MGTAHEEYLKEIAHLHDVHKPPRVEVVAEVGPSEQLERIASCMHDEGWTDVKIESGGLRYPWDPDDPEQREAMGLALYTCYAKYPIKAELLRPSEEVYRRLYDYFTDELAPCLRSHGFDISPAPGWDYWLHAVEHDQVYWDPSSEVPAGEYPVDACARMPPEFR